MLYKNALPKFYEYIEKNRNKKFNKQARFLFDNIIKESRNILEFKHILPNDLKRSIASASIQLQNYYKTPDVSYERKIKNQYNLFLEFAKGNSYLGRSDKNQNIMAIIQFFPYRYAKEVNISNKHFNFLITLLNKLYNIEFFDVDRSTLYSLIHNLTYYKFGDNPVALENSRKSFLYIADVFIEFVESLNSDTNPFDLVDITIDELLNCGNESTMDGKEDSK